MSVYVFVHFRPRKGKEESLIQLLREQAPRMRGTGLITDRKATCMKTGDGGIILVHEFVSQEARDKASENPEVQEMWMDVDRVSAFEEFSEIKAFRDNFPEFEGIDLE